MRAATWVAGPGCSGAGLGGQATPCADTRRLLGPALCRPVASRRAQCSTETLYIVCSSVCSSVLAAVRVPCEPCRRGWSPRAAGPPPAWRCYAPARCALAASFPQYGAWAPPMCAGGTALLCLLCVMGAAVEFWSIDASSCPWTCQIGVFMRCGWGACVRARISCAAGSLDGWPSRVPLPRWRCAWGRGPPFACGCPYPWSLAARPQGSDPGVPDTAGLRRAPCDTSTTSTAPKARART